MCSHLLCAPLWHLTGNQRERDHAAQSVEPWISKVGVVEDVVRIRADLEPKAVCHMEALT